MNNTTAITLSLQERLLSRVSRRRIVVVSVFVLVCVLILEIWAMNRLAVMGEKISKIESAKKNLSLENQLLENQVASRGSLGYIKKMADNLGFSSNTSLRLKYIQSLELALNK